MGHGNMGQTFGETLREVRRARNISQRELAEKVSVDFSYISKVENDRIPTPSADTVERICTVLGVPSETLLSLSGKITSEATQMLSKSAAAQKFVKHAQTMSLTDDDWMRLTKSLKSLRK